VTEDFELQMRMQLLIEQRISELLISKLVRVGVLSSSIVDEFARDAFGPIASGHAADIIAELLRRRVETLKDAIGEDKPIGRDGLAMGLRTP
jgi:hypothetical protein